MKKYSGFLAIFTAAVLFSVFSVFIRILNDYVDTNQQVALRGFTGFIIAIALTLGLRRSWRELRNVNKKYLFFYAVSFPITILTFTIAVNQITIAMTIAAFYAGTLGSSLIIGNIFFKEKLTTQKALALSLGLIGISAIIIPQGLDKVNAGIFIALISGIFDAIANGFRKYFGGKVDRLVLSSIQMFAIFVLGASVSVISGNAIIPTLPVEIWLLGAIYGACILGVSILLLYGFSKFDLNLGTIVLSSELFISPLLAVIFLNEVPAVNEVIAACFIFFAVIVTELKFRK